MAADKKPPVIKKIIKKGHGGHHGGSWKVAYADFVTAMMAFFLVMWLLAISSEQGKQALADYFKELTLTDAVFNGGLPSAFDPSSPSPGILQGGCFDLKNMGRELEEKEKQLDEREKALQEQYGEPAKAAAAVPTNREQNADLTDLPPGQKGGEGSDQTGVAPGSGPQPAVTPGQNVGTSAEAQRAKAAFANDLKSAVESALSDQTGGQFSVEVVPGGLKIQLMDKEGRPMFVSGQPRLTPEAQLILKTIADRLMTIPNKIALEGHTDAVATISQELTNWELSTARASAARRFLGRQGITDDRLTMVAGYSSTQPLPMTNPTDPVNRRIAIMIWDDDRPSPSNRETTAPTAPGQVQPTAPQTPAPSVAPSPGQEAGSTAPQSPTQESLEKLLLDQTLHQAASPDTSTAGPPVDNRQ
ncbi:MAG: OmpA family protein [Deltaproteobacteria bacterium]|nr:OmpA family protein [Deltaproteobacteria bacterium]